MRMKSDEKTIVAMDEECFFFHKIERNHQTPY